MLLLCTLKIPQAFPVQKILRVLKRVLRALTILQLPECSEELYEDSMMLRWKGCERERWRSLDGVRGALV